jgi:deoxyribodipyrimidine photo-lyase
MEQMKKFDPAEEYVRRWVPDYGSPGYPEPMIEHRFARKRALETYKRGIESYLPEA